MTKKRLLSVPMALVVLLLSAAIATACGPAPQSASPIPTPTPTADLLITIGDVVPDASIKPLLGVNAGPLPAGEGDNPDLTDAYQQIGVNAVRTHDFYGPLDMAVMYPDRTRDPTDPNSYDFEASDAVFAAILDGGFEPYLRLGDSWNNATPPSGPVERANWVQAAVEVIRHYREGQWDGFNSDLSYVEIWNEPDNAQFWPAPHTRIEFFELFEDTARALKAAFPDLQVGGPGLTPAGAMSPAGRQYTQSFLDYMQSNDVPLDFFSWHMYANDPSDFVDAAIFYRELLDSHGYGSAESHITEWNTGVKRVDREEAMALRVGMKSAAVMTAAWIGLQEQGVDVSTFYRGTDATITNPTWYGLFLADGRPKRVAQAFALWSEMAAHWQRLNLSAVPVGGSEDGELWTLAGQDAEGEIALLIANPNDTATTWQIAFSDDRSLADYTVAVRQVSEASEEAICFTPPEEAVEIGAYTVQLVLLSRSSGLSPVSEAAASALNIVANPGFLSETPQRTAVWEGANRSQGILTSKPPGGELITYVDSPGIGEIAVKVRVPETPRYPEGAGVAVEASTFWVNPHGFYISADVTELGLIHIAYLWPGKEDPCGAKSSGTFDYGGEESIRALRDVIRFAAGQIPNRDGLYLEDLIAITPLNDTVGLYAFSHPGIAAVNVLALHGDQLSVGYFVGRENPTLDVLSAVEMGHWGETGQPVFNPLYSYPQAYTPTRLVIDYSSVRWDPDYEDEHIPYVGRPYFDLNSNGQRDEADYVLGHRGSVMFDKRNYSIPLTRALRENGAIDEADWPSDLATPEEVEAIWSFRSSVHRYPHLATKTPDLKVMLVFARHDHVQPAHDKPHIHQAYDGFHHAAGLWTRLNPDQAYVEALNSGLGQVSPEHPANAEPNDWLEIEAWGHADGQPGTTLVPLAAVAEMADRMRANNWDDDLDEVLVEYPPPQPTPRRVYLPLLMKDWFGEPTVITDVTFATVEGESLALDAYLPATPGPHPAVILIHGGYWQTGDKESHSRLGEWMAEHGYAAFAINYRLAPEFPFPAAVADVQCAITWLREHAAEYDVDADRIALMGTSAGGHLAALAGLSAAPSAPSATWQPSCGEAEADVNVQAIISCFGPVDLAFHAQESEGAEDIVTVLLGGQTCQDAPQLCAAASPMTYATADAPPTLLIHGTDDDAVSCENSARLYDALNGVGAEVTYLPVEGAQHGFIIGVRSPKAQAALDAVEDFLAANL